MRDIDPRSSSSGVVLGNVALGPDVASTPPPPWFGPYVCLLLGYACGAVIQKVCTDAGHAWGGFIAFVSLIAVVSAASYVSARARGLL